MEHCLCVSKFSKCLVIGKRNMVTKLHHSLIFFVEGFTLMEWDKSHFGACWCSGNAYILMHVVINGATKEIGKVAVVAVTKACRIEVAGTMDTCHIGENIGKICGTEELLQIPIINDLIMILGSISQGVLVAPNLSIGSILLQQLAILASFHYNNIEIVESRANANGSKWGGYMMRAARVYKENDAPEQIRKNHGCCHMAQESLAILLP
ncbi:hypothetical protein JHK87_000572 [Glycine soja]|nr:hypothetical protein JHK87_000572 [Glycine soja]